VATSTSLTHCNLLRNEIDTVTAQSLVEAVKDKNISLAGIQPGQTSADFANQNLKCVDAVLLACDISKAAVGASLTALNLSNNLLADSSSWNCDVEGPGCLGGGVRRWSSTSGCDWDACEACHAQDHGHAHELQLIDYMAGINALALAIAGSSSLTELDIRSNKLGSDGGAVIRKAVSRKDGFKLEI